MGLRGGESGFYHQRSPSSNSAVGLEVLARPSREKWKCPDMARRRAIVPVCLSPLGPVRLIIGKGRSEPETKHTHTHTHNKELSTTTGHFSCLSMIKLRELRLPESNEGCIILDHDALVFDRPCCCDLVLGSEFLAKA